ncbi:hypothetical protein [Streptomyces sp. NPDC004528]|uniref:hypothetical protein n=1 Tax=Streptomyces sp. NPDC004528 TaxID=3154550 RepID=UPI0033A4D24E
MTDTTVRSYPETPATVAAAVLDRIEQYPDQFDMSTWFWRAGGSVLAPREAVDCGTTMCVAGWAAHVTGWTLRGSLAERGGETDYIENVGREALGLDADTDDLFWATADDAIEALREIAGR